MSFENETESKINLKRYLKNYQRNDNLLERYCFKIDIGFVNLHQTISIHWMASITGSFFDAFGCSLPKLLTDFSMKGNRRKCFRV